MKEKREFKLSIHGSRTLRDERVKIILLEEIKKYNPTTIVTHAEPGGVCEIARKLCKEQAIPLKVHFLNFRYLRGAFPERSKAVFRDSNYCIFIHDGQSKGCSNELKLCQKLGLPYKYYKIEKTDFEQSVGFEIEEEWEWDEIDIKDLE